MREGESSGGGPGPSRRGNPEKKDWVGFWVQGGGQEKVERFARDRSDHRNCTPGECRRRQRRGNAGNGQAYNWVTEKHEEKKKRGRMRNISGN